MLKIIPSFRHLGLAPMGPIFKNKWALVQVVGCRIPDDKLWPESMSTKRFEDMASPGLISGWWTLLSDVHSKYVPIILLMVCVFLWCYLWFDTVHFNVRQAGFKKRSWRIWVRQVDHLTEFLWTHNMITTKAQRSQDHIIVIYLLILKGHTFALWNP